MQSWPLLSLLTLLPLAGIVAVALAARFSAQPQDATRSVALGFSLAAFFASCALLFVFDVSSADYQLTETASWFPSLNIGYRRGVDGLGLAFLILSNFLCPLALAAGFSIRDRAPAFFAALLALQALLTGVFSSTDLVLFAFFFEGVLIPMFFIIGIWGGEKRIYAAMKFFLMTFTGSVLMLVALFAIAAYAGTTDMQVLRETAFPHTMQLWLWGAFFASFAVKTPLWPFHTWLPYAHGEAPTAGSVLLAGILLKMGGYGFIRIGMDILPEGHVYFAPAVMALAVVAIVYASLVALAQTDIKRLIAYTSVAHMGTAILGLFAGSILAFQGGVFVMISHGLVSAGLFLAAGVVYDRFHTRDLAKFGGLAKTMPFYTTFFLILILASIGVPGTSGFVGEFMALLGVFRTEPVLAAGGALGIVLGAAAMLRLYGLVFTGSPREAAGVPVPDLTFREKALLFPLVVLVLFLGLSPAPVRTLVEPSLAKVALSVESKGAR